MKYLFLCLFTCIATLGKTQKSNAKFDKAIKSLNDSEFITKYKDYKSQVEIIISEFKANSYSLNSYQIEQVKNSFDKSKVEFDGIADSMKKDLMDSRTRDFICANPEQYTKFINGTLENAYENFANNTLQLINQYSSYNVTGISIAEIQLLVGLVTELAGVVKGIRSNMKKMDETYFENNFIRNLRIKSWEEL